MNVSEEIFDLDIPSRWKSSTQYDRVCGRSVAEAWLSADPLEAEPDPHSDCGCLYYYALPTEPRIGRHAATRLSELLGIEGRQTQKKLYAAAKTLISHWHKREDRLRKEITDSVRNALVSEVREQVLSEFETGELFGAPQHGSEDFAQWCVSHRHLFDQYPDMHVAVDIENERIVIADKDDQTFAVKLHDLEKQEGGNFSTLHTSFLPVLLAE